MYGGKDYTKIQLNSATGATMQAGSTFKPFGLIAALEQGISTHDHVPRLQPADVPRVRRGQRAACATSPTSSSATSTCRPRPRTRSTPSSPGSTSRSAPTRPATAAIAAGLPANTPGLQDNLSNIFGTANPHVIDMANAYATIAAKGHAGDAVPGQEGTSADGSVNYKAQKQTKVAFDQDVAIDATEAMTHVVTEGTGQGALALGRPAAGKTGTTTENKAVWFDGFTPQLAAAVGIYNDVNGKPKPMQNIAGFGELTGGTFPVKIWTALHGGRPEGDQDGGLPAAHRGG